MVVRVVHRQHVAALVGGADRGDVVRVVVIPRYVAAVLIKLEANRPFSQPRRAGNRSRQADAHGLGVGAVDIDLVGGLQLVMPPMVIFTLTLAG